MARIRELGSVGRLADGSLSRLAGTDADRAGRDLLGGWMRAAGLAVTVDAVGNMFGHRGAFEASPAPVMLGSHIDSVVNAGIYDGSYGVLAALEVVECLHASGAALSRPVVVAAFTNEEGVRFTPDMMGSLVYAGGFALDDALAAVASDDGRTLGAELERIGYAGAVRPGAVRPHAYLELHIEQGPILEREGVDIGAVQNLQGISWQRLVVDGKANHAGTTPMALRSDAGYAAARLATFLHDYAGRPGSTTVGTVGTLRLEPNAINIIPGRATLTVDLRDPDEARLVEAEAALAAFLPPLAADARVRIATERLVRLDPVTFDEGLVGHIEAAARDLGLRVRRMTSGAGHDAQMMARVCPSAMIFVPSEEGVSHSPRERTSEAHLAAGANVLLAVAGRLAGA